MECHCYLTKLRCVCIGVHHRDMTVIVSHIHRRQININNNNNKNNKCKERQNIPHRQNSRNNQ